VSKARLRFGYMDGFVAPRPRSRRRKSRSVAQCLLAHPRRRANRAGRWGDDLRRLVLRRQRQCRPRPHGTRSRLSAAVSRSAFRRRLPQRQRFDHCSSAWRRMIRSHLWHPTYCYWRRARSRQQTNGAGSGPRTDALASSGLERSDSSEETIHRARLGGNLRSLLGVEAGRDRVEHG
jgi:hypothetical protein